MSSAHHTKDRPAPAFAPSPPLSASTSDCEPNTVDTDLRHDIASKQAGAGKDKPHAPSPEQTAGSSFTSNSTQDDGRHGDVDEAFSLIKASWEGSLPDLESLEWHVLQISPQQYEVLRSRFESYDPALLSYFEDELRCDYDPESGVLVLRLMASAIHDTLQSIFWRHVLGELQKIAASSQDAVVSQLVSCITPSGGTKVRFPSKGTVDKKSPDGQVRFLAAGLPFGNMQRFQSRHPQFVVEIGYSQDGDSLQELAKDYYEKSQGRVKTVLTIDIEYHKDRQGVTHAATLSLYRGPKRVLFDASFRDASGRPQAGTLDLLLTDFLPNKVLRQLEGETRRQVEAASMRIDFQELCELLSEAEKMQEIDDASSSSESESDSGPRGSSPRKRKTVEWEVVRNDSTLDRSKRRRV